MTGGRAAGLSVLTALAGVAVLVDELVLWAGQPTGDPTSAEVGEWYDAHAGAVLLGDTLWLAACGVLVAALWTAGAHFPAVPRWTVRAVGLTGTTVLAVSALLASRLALGLPDDALAIWRQEATAFRAGTILLALTMVPLLDGLVSTRRRALVAPAALVGLALAVPATAGLGLAAVFVVVALAVPGSSARGKPAARVAQRGRHLSGSSTSR